VFCLIDDWLAGQRLRQRGPQPTLADSEVLTIECVGEFLGIDTDSGLYQYFRRHYRGWFPGLDRVHRTTLVRQAANLWVVNQQLHQHLLDQVELDPAVWLVDSVAVPICRFARAYRCRRLRELTAWGHDEVAKQTYLGLRAHLRVCWPGVIVDGRLAPANLSDLASGEELLAEVTSWTLADRNYGSARLAEQLATQGGWLLAPARGTRRSRQRPPPWLTSKRPRSATSTAMRSDSACRTGLHQARLVGGHDSLGAVAQTELGQDPADVGLDGFVADHEPFSDLEVGQSLCDQA